MHHYGVVINAANRPTFFRGTAYSRFVRPLNFILNSRAAVRHQLALGFYHEGWKVYPYVHVVIGHRGSRIGYATFAS